jgi:hypothetical protein
MTRFWRGAGGANFNKKVGSEFPVRELLRIALNSAVI